MKGSSATKKHGVTRKRRKRLKPCGKPVWKEPKNKRCLLILDLKPFRSRSKESIFYTENSRIKFVRGKKLVIFPLKILMVTEKSCNLSVSRE